MSSGQVNSVDYGQGHATFMDNYQNADLNPRLEPTQDQSFQIEQKKGKKRFNQNLPSKQKYQSLKFNKSGEAYRLESEKHVKEEFTTEFTENERVMMDDQQSLVPVIIQQAPPEMAMDDQEKSPYKDYFKQDE